MWHKGNCLEKSLKATSHNIRKPSYHPWRSCHAALLLVWRFEFKDSWGLLLLHFTVIYILSYSINWPVWLPFFRETLGNMCFAILYQPDCDDKLTLYF